MNDIELLDERRESVATVQHKILSRYDKKKKQLFTVFEGKEDRSYYIPRIKNIIDGSYDYDVIVEEIAFGKANVLALRDRLNWKVLNAQQFLFFVDKDLAFWLDKEVPNYSNVFVTDYYSVENYCVNESVFKELLLNIKGFTIAEYDDINHLLELFNEWKESFEYDMRKAMAIAIIAKKNNPELTLSEVLFTEGYYSFSYNDGVFQNTIHYNKLRKKLGVSTNDYDDLIEEQLEMINNNLNEYSVQGKWLLTGMGRLAEYFRINVSDFIPSIKNKLKGNTSVSETQLFPIVSQYDLFSIPNRLIDIIHYNYCAYLAA